MWKWLRDTRYDEVVSSLKQVQADMQFLDAKIEAMKTNVNSLRGLWNKKVSKSSEDSAETSGTWVPDDLETIRAAFGGQLPLELAHLDKYKNKQE